MWKAEELYNKSHPNWNEIKRAELSFQMAKKLKEFSDKQKIEFFCSAFYPEGVDFLEGIGVKKYKIASRTCLFKDPYSYETLISKAKTRKPVIISMGMGGNKQKIKNIFKKNNITFCYCISKYPTQFHEIDWNNAIRFDGFSDHTTGIIAPIVFAILKKTHNSKNILIEKHVKLANSKGPDASSSLEVKKFSEMISSIRTIEKTKI